MNEDKDPQKPRHLVPLSSKKLEEDQVLANGSRHDDDEVMLDATVDTFMDSPSDDSFHDDMEHALANAPMAADAVDGDDRMEDVELGKEPKESATKAVDGENATTTTAVAFPIAFTNNGAHKRMRRQAYKICLFLSSIALSVITTAIVIRYIAGVPGKPDTEDDDDSPNVDATSP